MSRYIDITTINPRVYESSEVELGVLAYDYDEIQAMPFLDIVSCKECNYSRDSFGVLMCDKNRYSVCVKPDDFCSYGERREP